MLRQCQAYFSSRSSSSTQSNSTATEIQVCYVATNNNDGLRRSQQQATPPQQINDCSISPTAGDNNQRLNRSVTFAKPIVSNVREIEPLDRHHRHASPILAGHPSIHPSANNGGGPAVCRICYSTENSGPTTGEPLISPCNCKGTMGLYHRTCLNRWLHVSNNSSCEICHFKFQTKRVKRSFSEYLHDADTQAARRTLLSDFLCFLLLTPLVTISAVVCCLSAIQLIKEDTIERQRSDYDALFDNGLQFEIAIALFFLSAVLMVVYFIWLGVTGVFHKRAFRRWQSTHWNCIIVDQLSLEESMLINGSFS